MSTAQITADHRRYVEARIHCPQAADDVLQDVAIHVWQAATGDAALVWSIVKRRTVDAIRRAVRRGARFQPLTPDVDRTIPEATTSDSPALADLLPAAGRYADDVRAYYLDGAERTPALQRRASRGVALIRESCGVV